MKRGLRIFALIVPVMLLGACSSGVTKVESDLDISGAPDWVNEGSQSLKTDKGRLIHGVGSAEVMGDLSLQLSVADNRARSEVARVLRTYMDVVVKDYSTSRGQETDASVVRDIRSSSEVLMSGVRIIGRWRDGRKKTVWSIAELDLDQVSKITDAVEKMDPGLADYMRREGDATFDRISRGDKQ